MDVSDLIKLAVAEKDPARRAAIKAQIKSLQQQRTPSRPLAQLKISEKQMAEPSKWERFKGAMRYDVSGEAAQKIKNAATSLNQATKTYTPTLRKATIGSGKLALQGAGIAGAGLAGAGVRAQALGGAAWGAGAAIGRVGINKVVDVLPSIIWILSAIIVWTVDFTLGFNGIDPIKLYNFLSLSGFQGIRNIVNTFVIAGLIIYSVMHFFKRKQQNGITAKSMIIFLVAAISIPLLFQTFPEFNYFKITASEIFFLLILFLGGAEVLAVSLVIIMLSMIVTYGGLEIGVFFHLAFALAFWLLLLRKLMPDKSEADLSMAIYLFADFFAFSIFGYITNNSIIANRLFIPIPLLAFIIYGYELPKDWLSKLLTGAVILFYVAYAFTLVISFSDLSSQLDSGQKTQAIEAFQVTWEKIKNIYFETETAAREGINDTKNTLTGQDYYTAQVDQNAKEKLGVYMEDLKPASDYFMTEEKALIEGKLTAKSIDGEVKIKSLVCLTDQTENRKKQTIAGSINPNATEENPLIVYNTRTESFGCEIPRDYPNVKFMPGTKNVVVRAEFDFKTSAYLKSYFKEKSQLMQMYSEGIDPFEQLGIKDKNPVTVYTNGPIKLAFGMRGAMIDLDSTKPTEELPLVFIINNDWQGKITDIKKIYFILPKGMTLKTDEGKPTYCFGYTLTQADCSNVNDDQNEWCSAENFNIYEYDGTAEGKKITDNSKAIEKEQRMLCRVNVETAQILGEDMPYMTQYVRAIMDYSYQLQKSVSITVKASQAIS